MLTIVYLKHARTVLSVCMILTFADLPQARVPCANSIVDEIAVTSAPLKGALSKGAPAPLGLGDDCLAREFATGASALRGLGDNPSTCAFASNVALPAFPLAAFENMSTGKALLALGAVLFIITILNINARRKRLGQTPKRKDAERLDRKAEALRRELEALVVELSEFSRQANGQVDTRFAKLEHSIRDADERIAELTALLEAAGVAVPKRNRSMQFDGRSATDDADGAVPSPSQGEGRGEGFDARAGSAFARGQLLSQNGGLSTTHPTGSGGAGSVPIGARHSEDADIDDSIMAANQEAAAGVRGGQQPIQAGAKNNAGRTEPSGDRDEQICALIDKGLTVADVAERLRCSIGEVELVLNLRGRG